MSGGTEGVLSPHITVFTRAPVVDRSDDISGKRLSIGMAHTRDFLPEELGRGAQIEETAKAVVAAMADAAIVDPQDVHFVQIKCPLLTSDRIEAASGRGNKTVTSSAYGSMAYSRGASALGVAVALGEIDGAVGDEQVLRNFELFSSVASTSAGIELMHNVVIVLGNSASSASPFEIGHAVMRDAIDSAAVIEALKSVGLRPGDVFEPDGKPSTGQYLREGGSLAQRQRARISAHHARGYRHQRYSARPRRRWRIDRRPVGDRCHLCFRRSRTSGSAWRRARSSNRADINREFRLKAEHLSATRDRVCCVIPCLAKDATIPCRRRWRAVDRRLGARM